MGAHQPDWRLPLAQQRQDRRGQVQAATAAAASLTCFIFRFLRRPQIVTAGSTAYRYDANGNLLDDGINTYAWDAADRLVTITNQQTGHTSQFAYDGLSRRVSATETDSGGTPETTHYLWCGTRICEARDSSDTVLARYYAQGELHGSTIAYYAQDQVGSVVATVDPQGQVTARLKYDSYGTITSSSGTLPDYRYAGLYAHPQSGVYLATYRAYDPKIGRWLSRDPIREAGGLNLYGYVGGNPLSHRDPLGLLNPAEAACIAGPNPVCAGGLVGDAVTTVVGVGIIVYNHYHSEYSDEDSCGAKDNPLVPTDSDRDEWIYGPEDDRKVNSDGSTGPSTWTTPDDYSNQGEAQDNLDPFKPLTGRRPVRIPKGTPVQTGKTPGGEGPYNGSGGANETHIPGGLPPGSAGPWEPFQ